MRRTIYVLCVFVIWSCLMAGGASAQPDNPRMRVSWSAIQPEDLANFSRAGAPYQPVDVRPEIKALDSDQLLRLLNRSRREIRNRVLRYRLHGKFPEEIASDLERTYRLMPAVEIQGFDVDDDQDLELVFLEARSQAYTDNLATGTCELEVIYDNPPADQNPALPHVPASADKVLTAAKAVVAIIDEDLLVEVTGGYELEDRRFTILDGFDLCDFSALFGLPITAIYGTGFLIEGDLIVTAAHVANSTNFLERARFLFDYTIPDPGGAKDFFTDGQVYRAAEEVYNLKDEDGRDFAVIRLKTVPPPEKYPSLTLRSEGRIDDKAKVFTIGHPLGLPQMYTGPKELYENGPCVYFLSTLDTYDYQSGSPVINAETGVVEGILTTGTKEIRTYCNCDAPTASGPGHGMALAQANRAKMVSDVLAMPDDIIVINESSSTVMVRTDTEHAFSTTQTDTIPHTSEMFLNQLPDTSGGGTEWRCTIQYFPIPGEVWKILEGDQPGNLIMARCTDATPSNTE